MRPLPGQDQSLLAAVLHRTDHAAQREVDDEVDDTGRTEQHHDVGDVHRAKAVVGACGAQQLTDAGHQLDGGHIGQIRRVLDGGDDLTEQGGHDVAVGLRQDDVQQHLNGVEALCITGLELALGHAIQAAADDLGDD